MLEEILKAWLVPPALNAVMLIIGLLLLRWYRAAGRFLMVISVASLLLISTDYIASLLERSIQKHSALNTAELPDNVALTIVVAGSSHHGAAEEYGYPTPTSVSLARLHYASFLQRKTGYPVLLTGGVMNKNQIHSEILANSFLNEFKTQAQWLEKRSQNTYENAKYSAEILFPLGRKTIVLVTHSYHMHRAVKLFQQAGFTVIPAPTIIARDVSIGKWQHWVPGANGLQRSTNVVYEYFGLIRDKILPKPVHDETNCTELAPC